MLGAVHLALPAPHAQKHQRTINKGNAKIHPTFSRKTSHVDQCGNKQPTDKNASATLVA